MKRSHETTPGGRLYSLSLLLLAASCQEPNPDFDGPASGAGTASPTSSSEGDDPASSESGAATGPGSSGSPPTTGPETTTGTPPATSGDTTIGDPSDGSTGDCTDCAGQCVDTNTDPNHCGMCNNKCNPGQEHCQMGECVPH
jgi:hypothetical protein